MFITVLFTFAFVLIGCSDNNENANNDQNNGNNTEANNEQNNDDNVDENHSQNENNDSGSNNLENDNENNDGNNNTDGSFEPEEEDQEGLDIGDTGKFDTTLGSYEMTLDDAELVGPELDGEQTQLDDLILLDLTIKNTSDEKLNIEDLMESMLVGNRLEGGGSYDGAEDFDSVDEFTGKLDPGDEKSGQFITDVNNSDIYYFKKTEGNIGAGGSNQVIWEFEPEE